MSAPAVIEGDYADLKFIKSRSVVQMIIEVPIESGSELVRMFGTPIPGAQVPVAVARLARTPTAASTQSDKRKLTELPAPQQAALTCQREAFWRYIDEQHTICGNEHDAANFVRHFCKVGSRSELATSEVARQRWNLLLSGFEAWMKAA